MAESGSTVVWVGEEGVRYYAHGRSLAHSSRLLEAQAALMTNQSSRLRVAREMYAMRFAGEDTRGLTMQQLRGREGVRVKRAYREHSERTGVAWRSRSYVPGDFDKADTVNKALSAANTAMYGAVHSAVVALGCSPGLGFVHTGHDRSFVYDVADLYKADMVIPTAFDAAAEEGVEDIGAHTRRTMRDVIHKTKLLERCVRDVRHLLLGDTGSSGEEVDLVSLWDDRSGEVAAGQNYDYEVDW